jgi:hypothetical protein
MLKPVLGKGALIVIVCVVAGMHLFSLGAYFSLPDPAAVGRAVSDKLASEAEWNDKLAIYRDPAMRNMVGDNVRNSLALGLQVRWLGMLGSCAISGILLVFLCCGSPVGRVLLGLFLLLEGVLLVGSLVMVAVAGNLRLLQYLPPQTNLLLALESVVRLGVAFGVGVKLLRSRVEAGTGRNATRNCLVGADT